MRKERTKVSKLFFMKIVHEVGLQNTHKLKA